MKIGAGKKGSKPKPNKLRQALERMFGYGNREQRVKSSVDRYKQQKAIKKMYNEL